MNRTRLLQLATASLLLPTVLLLTSCSEEAPAPERNPVLFLGVDGATWDVIDPMIERGELPNFAALKKRGAWGDLITVGPQVSPVVWTTFATGQFGRRHGILDFVFPYTPGPKKPVESTIRQEPAIWNIASEAGRSVGVVGYFASHPAEAVNGVMVTDRAFQRLEGSVYPADWIEPLTDRLKPYYKYKHQKELWKRFFPWDYDPKSEELEDPKYAEANLMVAKRVDNNIVYSYYLQEVTNALLEQQQHDLFITYFRNPDYTAHSLWWYYDDSEYDTKPDPFTQSLLADVLPESYRYVDDVLGDILERIPANTNIVIVSDHGGGSATGRYTVKREQHKLLTGNHRPDGVFLAAGPDISPGQVRGMTIMEIFPMVMALLDLPLADDIPGKLDHRPFRDGFFDDHPVQTVPSYGNRKAEPAVDVAIDDEAQKETLNSLQGLGYIGEGFEFGDRDLSETSFWDADSQLVMFSVTGELVYWVLREDVDVAIEVLELAWERRPDVARILRQRTEVEFEVVAERFEPGFLPEDALQRFLDRAEVLQQQHQFDDVEAPEAIEDVQSIEPKQAGDDQ
jgi:hypothetical protein